MPWPRAAAGRRKARCCGVLRTGSTGTSCGNTPTCRRDKNGGMAGPRPTSGASTDVLAAQLREVRRRTHRLIEDLSALQLTTPPSDGSDPVLRQVEAIGRFHERWTLGAA